MRHDGNGEIKALSMFSTFKADTDFNSKVLNADHQVYSIGVVSTYKIPQQQIKAATCKLINKIKKIKKKKKNTDGAQKLGEDKGKKIIL